MAARRAQVALKHPYGLELPSHPFTGLDLREGETKYTKPGALLLAQNVLPYEQFVLSMRRGTVFLNAVAWPGVNRLPFALRYPGASFKLVCANLDSGDLLASIADADGAATPLTGATFSANQRWRGIVAGETPTAYFGNPADTIVKTTDGITCAALTGAQIPAKGLPFGPYFDRILCLDGKRLYYSRSNNDADWSNAGGNPQYLFINHPENGTAAFLPGPDRSDVGYSGKLYVTTPTSTWTHLGDFEGLAGGSTESFFKVHETAGIGAVNTLAWTDRGVIGLGVENVWFFPIDGIPFPVGYKIQPLIRAIPAAYRHRCSGAYRNGFYVLSYVRAGQTAPDRELYADLRGMSPLAEDYGVQWYGPMVRPDIGIECYLAQPQAPDENELFAFSATEGRCMQLETDIYTDNGAEMECLLTPADLGTQIRGLKNFVGFILGIEISDDDAVEILYDVDGGRAAGTKTVSLTMGGATWGETTPAPSDAIWDVSVFAGAYYQTIQRLWGTKPLGSRVRQTLKHTSANRFRVREFSALAHAHGRVE